MSAEPRPPLSSSLSSRKTIVRRSVPVSAELAASELPPLLQRLYANRHIHSPQQLQHTLDGLPDYRLMKHCERAAAIIADALQAQQHIMVVGDYDADGATSTAVVLRALRACGHRHYSHLVPNRFDFGYGLSPELVEVARDSQPDLIITVDNGIASIDGVAHANALGIDVVITDHHLAADSLPAAAAIVNPNQAGCEFPAKTIAGVGVAFYVMLALRAELRQRGHFDSASEPNMAQWLDLVALGTVADVVPLDQCNRILVEQGLRRIRSGHACAGIAALLQVAGRNPGSCCAQDFAFAVAPRLNAAGRLEDMSVGIECLLSEDFSQALQIAQTLDAINKQRRHIEADMLAQANTLIESSLQALLHNDGENVSACSVCLYDANWHQGVVGLLASRIKERLHRPVIAFARADAADEGNTELKGSARSIPGVHIRDVLDAIDKRHPGMIIKFGGHAMAAGLSLHAARLPQFRQALEQEVREQVDDELLQQSLDSDGGLDATELCLHTAEQLRYAGPWGQHFPAPLFDDVFEVVDWRIVGEKHLKLRLRPQSGGEVIDAIAFNHSADDLPAGGSLHAAYRLDVNEYNGKKTAQLIIEHIQPVEQAV